MSCAHLDFKPENILVWWREDDQNELTSAFNQRKPAGIWKLNDFGISRLRSVENASTNADLQVTRGDMLRERPSIEPPRGPGLYQAPEMNKETGTLVSIATDMWSLGGVLAMLLAFTIGGPQKLGELYSCRTAHYSDDYFYR